MDANTIAVLILLGSFFVMILMRVPIAYAVGLSTVFCLMYMGKPLTTIPQQLVKGMWSFSLMAVPFFITMGSLMGSGGISEKLVALANSAVGWMRGGLGMVNVVDSYFFGGISGSAAADTASLGSILIVVVGVVMGAFTATESAAIAVVYSLFVSVYVYKGLNWKGVWNALNECVNTLAIVLILIATSTGFGYCLTLLHVPDLAAKAIMSVSDNPVVIALLINLILLVLGMVMDMAPIILISTPILLPIATSIGISPITYGIMLMLNCGIGLLTPPVGSVLFIGSAVAKVPMEKVVKAMLPFYLCMIAALLLITFIPQITLFLPGLFM